MSDDRIHRVDGGVMYWCPACQTGHGGKGWTESPHGSVRPSVICDVGDGRCHTVVTDYVISFVDDCANGWAGKALPLEAF